MEFGRPIYYVAQAEHEGCPPAVIIVSVLGWNDIRFKQDLRTPEQIEKDAVDKGLEVWFCSIASYIGRSRKQGEQILQGVSKFYQSLFPDKITNPNWVELDFTHRIMDYREVSND